MAVQLVWFSAGPGIRAVHSEKHIRDNDHYFGMQLGSTFNQVMPSESVSVR
jgi:hypothetical protein